MLSSIEGQSVVVTGGSKGIGKGIAKVFAARGAKVMIAARGEEAGYKAVEELRAQGGYVEFCPCDVSDWSAVKNLMSTAAERFGSLNVLCANAGIYPTKRIFEMEPDEWDKVQSSNLKSAFLCVKAAIPYFEQACSGRVVLTSSITGPFTGIPGCSHYGASKSGQLGFMRTACMELIKHNVTINAVLPGNIITEGLMELGQDYIDSMAASIPMKRLGCTEDIGHAALFFASKEASYITGQTLVVDGGQIIPESLKGIAGIG